MDQKKTIQIALNKNMKEQKMSIEKYLEQRLQHLTSHSAGGISSQMMTSDPKSDLSEEEKSNLIIQKLMRAEAVMAKREGLEFQILNKKGLENDTKF